MLMLLFEMSYQTVRKSVNLFAQSDKGLKFFLRKVTKVVCSDELIL